MLNKSNTPYRMVLDFSQAKNLLFSTKKAKIERVIIVYIIYYRL